VTFRYRDTETKAERFCTLEAEEFIHRFLQHVLPKGFVKVRYYGLFQSWPAKATHGSPAAIAGDDFCSSFSPG